MKKRVDSSKNFIECRNLLVDKIMEFRKVYNKTEDPEVLDDFKKIMHAYQKLEALNKSYSTYDLGSFGKFMKQFLVLTDGDYKFSQVNVIDYNNDEKLMKRYFIITDEAANEYVKESIDSQAKLERFFEINKDRNVVVFDEEEVYPFDKTLKVKPEFSKFPGFEDAIYELLDLKLKNPNMEDQDRFNQVLENTVRRNLMKSQNKEKVK